MSVFDQHMLPPATERMVMAAFDRAPLITAQKAAELLGVDEKTLRIMGESGVIRSVIVGASTRRYTEADIRAFLAGERFGEVKLCQSTNRRTARSGNMTSNTGVIGFTEARAKRLARKPKR